MSADQLHYKSIIRTLRTLSPRRAAALRGHRGDAEPDRESSTASFTAMRLSLPNGPWRRQRSYDGEIAKGIWRGPLHGVPIGLKDLCYTTFAPTAGGTTDSCEVRAVVQRDDRGSA